MAVPAIAIIGAGPCGLTLARLLECRGIDYVVYERDTRDDPSRAGGSLDLDPETGQRALREAGVFDAFQKYARYDDTVFAIADKAGKRVMQIGQGRDAPEIDRAELRQLLLDHLPKEKIKWGHALASVALGERDKRPVLHFANGTVASGFKLVVGADGAWSKTRALITKVPPKYAEKCYLEARINPDNPYYETAAALLGRGSSMAVGDGKVVITQRQGSGAYRTYFGLPTPDEHAFRRGGGGSTSTSTSTSTSSTSGTSAGVDLQDAEAVRRLLLSSSAYFADWADEHRQLIAHATDFRAWPLYSLPADDLGTWPSVPGVTLAGDAAHLALPGGEGVNLAMADALDLVGKIAEHGGGGAEIGHLDEAVAAYEAEMYPRGAMSIRRGAAAAASMFADGPEAFLEMLRAHGHGTDD